MLTLGRSDPVGAPQVVYRAKKLCWQGPRRLLKFGCCSWASSSAGRAPRSQRGGRGFESPLVHQISKGTYIIFGNRVLLVLWFRLLSQVFPKKNLQPRTAQGICLSRKNDSRPNEPPLLSTPKNPVSG